MFKGSLKQDVKTMKTSLHKNKCKILEVPNNGFNNNKVAQTITKGTKLEVMEKEKRDLIKNVVIFKKKIDKLKQGIKEALESYELDQMTTKVLEKCIKDLEVDYAKAKEVCEIDRLMVVCIERVIFNMELERDLLASANKANHRKVIRTMRQVKELEGKVTELALDATLKQKLMDIEILKHENKILETKDQLK